MWTVYGTVALLFGMLLFLGLKFAEPAEPVDCIIIIILGLICVFAGLDWLNLIPEV